MSEDNKRYSAEWWISEVGKADKRLNEGWRNGADRVVKLFKDVRDGSNDEYRYNIFWSNVGILKASLYARPPKPMVTRQHGDPKDQIARVAATMLERVLEMDLVKDKSDMHEAFRLCVEDRLIPGLGQIWLRYEVTTQPKQIPEVTDPTTGTVIAPAATYDAIVDERVCTDYVQWRDFLWSPARTWDEVWWVGRRVWMSKSKLKARFGSGMVKKIGDSEKELKFGSKDGLPKGFVDGKAEIFEIWCRETKTVYWVCSGVDEFLDKKPDPLKLEDFFPCPKPLLATHTTDDVLPRPDYVILQDQYSQLDELSTRITLLEKALRVVGVYDKSNAEVKRILSDARENDMIPVDNWAMLAERGGLKGTVDWFPVEVIAMTLEKLMVQKQNKVQEIYELTGISDILRGATQANETAAAQKIKAKYASIRLQYLQDEVSLFAQAALRLKAEIVSSQFQPETIMRVSQMQWTEDSQYLDAAVQLLKDEKLAKLRIEINEESLALPDYNDERDTRVEYLTAVGQFLSQVQPIIQIEAGAAPYFLKMVQWVTSGFRGAREMEGVLNAAIAAVQNKPPAPPPPPPPEKIRSDAMLEQTRMEIASREKVEDMKIDSQQAMKILELVMSEKLGGVQDSVTSLKTDIDAIGQRFMQLEQLVQAAHQKAEASEQGINALNTQAQVDQAKAAAMPPPEQQGGGADAMGALMEQLTAAMAQLSKPRKRVPVRDPNTGDITHVIDQISEE